MLFPGIFNFTVGILIQIVIVTNQILRNKIRNMTGLKLFVMSRRGFSTIHGSRIHGLKFCCKNSKKELNDFAGFDKIESKQKNGAQESDNFKFIVKMVEFQGISKMH